jgi:hypothetical protein
MRFAPRLLVLLAASAVSLASAASSPAAVPDPLAALAAANGHPALVHMAAQASRVVEGRAVRVELEQLGPARLVRSCVAEVCSGSWFDGRRRWTFGINAVPLPEADDATTPVRRTLAAIASYAFAEPGFRAGGGTVVSRGADRFRVRAAGGAELDALIDPAGHTVTSVLTTAGEPVAVYGRPTRVGGATFALARGGPYETGPLDQAAARPGPLAPPNGPSVAYAGDGELALADQPIPVVPCRLGGRAVRCLIDSGANPSAIALPLVEALGLEPRGELEIAGFGRFATGLVAAGPLVVGAASFERVQLAVLPSAGRQPFDVVVGSDLLGKLRVSLDRAHDRARVTGPGRGGPPGPGTIPLTFRDGSPHVAAVLGGVPFDALFDSGDSALVSLGYAAYRAGPAWAVLGRGRASGVDASEDVLEVQVPAASVGPLALGPTRAIVRRTQADTHVGVALWRRCALELDEADATLTC